MERKDYAMIVLSVSLLASIGLNLMPEANYYCDDRMEKAYCFDLSSTMKTCYTLPNRQGGKRCSSLWQPIEIEIKEKVKIYANNKIYECEVKDNFIQRYSPCKSNDLEGWLGELL